MKANQVSRCCEIDCLKPAEWTIVSGSSPDDYTEACTLHVGELLCDAAEHKVYPLARGLFHPQELPWTEKGVDLDNAKPVMYWHDATQSYEVWQAGKCIALCANDLPNMQQWWNWVQVNIFMLPDHV